MRIAFSSKAYSNVNEKNEEVKRVRDFNEDR